MYILQKGIVTRFLKKMHLLIFWTFSLKKLNIQYVENLIVISLNMGKMCVSPLAAVVL